jgi:hypothetical protein
MPPPIVLATLFTLVNLFSLSLSSSLRPHSDITLILLSFLFTPFDLFTLFTLFTLFALFTLFTLFALFTLFTLVQLGTSHAALNVRALKAGLAYSKEVWRTGTALADKLIDRGAQARVIDWCVEGGLCTTMRGRALDALDASLDTLKGETQPSSGSFSQ